MIEYNTVYNIVLRGDQDCEKITAAIKNISGITCILSINTARSMAAELYKMPETVDGLANSIRAILWSGNLPGKWKEYANRRDMVFDAVRACTTDNSLLLSEYLRAAIFPHTDMFVAEQLIADLLECANTAREKHTALE